MRRNAAMAMFLVVMPAILGSSPVGAVPADVLGAIDYEQPPLDLSNL